MKVKELREKLAEYPDEMEILYCMCSDYEWLEAGDLQLMKAVPKPNGYVMRSHSTMSDENKAAERTYLLFPGN